MSCDDCHTDPVLEVLETLADARGYRLVRKEADRPSDSEQRFEELKRLFEVLPLNDLVAQVESLQNAMVAVSNRKQDWQKAYKARAKDLARLGIPGTRDHDYSQSNQPPEPPELTAEVLDVSNRLAIARTVLAVRIAREALDAVDATAAEENPKTEAA